MLFANTYKWTKKTCGLNVYQKLKTSHIILSEIPQVDINETDEYGFTGLHMASENGHLKVLKEMKKLLCAAHCRCFLKK